MPTPEHTLERHGSRWSCTGCDWEPPLGSTVSREFDKHLLGLRPTTGNESTP